MNKGFVIGALVLVAIGAVMGGLFGRFSTTSADTSVTAARIVTDYREAIDVIDVHAVGIVAIRRNIVSDNRNIACRGAIAIDFINVYAV